MGLPDWTINACAMGHAMITLYEATGEQVLQHTISVNNDFPKQAWVGTLFIVAFFLLRIGAKLKDSDMIYDALNQYYWHIKYLQDEKNSLCYHGYKHINRDHMSGFYWGRANC